MNLIIQIMFLLFGAAIGSFLSVTIYRIEKKKKGIILGRSACPNCKKTLNAIDMVPVLNYIYLRGKCRHCKKSISPHYFFLELSTALLLLLNYLTFPLFNETMTWQLSLIESNVLPFVFSSIITILLIGIFFYDLLYYKIPDVFLYPFVIVSALSHIVLQTNNIVGMLIGGAIGLIFFGGQYLVSKGKWIGEGDIYIGIGMGLLLGWQQMLLAMALTYILGAIISIALLVTKKATAKSKIPFAPFMVFGTLATMFYGLPILTWYLSLIAF